MPQVYANAKAERFAAKMSKAALLDIAWNLCLLGTDETEDQVLAKFCTEALITLESRGDATPSEIIVEMETIAGTLEEQ